MHIVTQAEYKHSEPSVILLALSVLQHRVEACKIMPYNS